MFVLMCNQHDAYFMHFMLLQQQKEVVFLVDEQSAELSNDLFICVSNWLPDLITEKKTYSMFEITGSRILQPWGHVAVRQEHLLAVCQVSMHFSEPLCNLSCSQLCKEEMWLWSSGLCSPRLVTWNSFPHLSHPTEQSNRVERLTASLLIYCFASWAAPWCSRQSGPMKRRFVIKMGTMLSFSMLSEGFSLVQRSVTFNAKRAYWSNFILTKTQREPQIPT